MADVAELVALIEPLARHFFGEPNRAQSKRDELRFGSHGSLSIDLKKGTWYDHETQEGGGVIDLVRRQKGFHSDGECFEWLEHEGLLKPNGRSRPQHERPVPVAYYDYTDEAGNLLFQVVRFEPKDFRQRVRDESEPSGWRWSVKGVRQVPYRLPELVEALANERVVFIVEGEKDCDRFWKQGAPATTNAGGAGKWRSELNKYFADADVVIIADNDPQAKNKAGELLFHPDGRPKFTGFDHAHAVAAELIDIAATVRVLDLGTHWTDCPPKGDISDWFDAHGTLDRLYAVAEQLPEWDESQAKRELPQAALKRATAYLAPDEASIPKRAWLHAGHYVRKAATATVAPGGFCKTTLSIYEAICMVGKGLSVWYISGEDPRDELDRRIAAHCAHHNIDLAQLPGRLFVDDQETYQFCIAKSSRSGTAVVDEAALQQFEQAILIDRIDAVILDPFISFHQVAENDNSSVDAVVKRLALIAKRCDCCIEISHHVRKPFAGQGSLTVDDARGGGAIINAVRSGRVINRMSSGEAEKANISSDDRHLYIRLDIGKRNMAPPQHATWFRLVPVPLKNGDSVQALIPWDYKLAGVTEADIEWVRHLVRQKAYRCDSKSPDWLGYEVAKRFGLNVHDKGDCIKINRLIGQWYAENAFQKMELRDVHTRKKFMFYVGMDAKSDEEKPETNVVQLFDPEERDD